MIHYYINPKTQALIAFDEETREVVLLQRVGEVMVTTFPESEPIMPARKIQSKPPKKSLSKTNRKPQNGENEEDKPVPKNRFGVDEATIKQIKELYADGKSMREIKEITGISYPTIYKYTTMQRKQRKREKDNGLDDERGDDLESERKDDGMDDENNF